jgi:integrase
MTELNLLETWKEFMDERSISLSPTTLATDYAQVTKWLKKCPIEDLTKGRQILTWILKQEPTLSARRVTVFVRSMYKWASAEDVAILQTNPVTNFRMPKPPQKDHEIVVIPKNEISLILATLAAKRSQQTVNWSLYVEFMLQTGMRTGEVRALKWKDIQDGKVVVHSNYTLTHGHKNSTKTNKQRKVPLNERAKEVLEEMRTLVLDSPDDYIFPWNRYSFQSFFRDKIDSLYESGLVKERYRPYDLRHVAISRWLEAGIPVTQAAQWAGNTSEVIWKHYAGVTQDFEMPVL